MSNACLFLSGKQNDTTRQLLHHCAASLNEQHTTYLIACSSLIPRSSVLGESHSQTISTGRVSFPDPQCWGSLIPRPPVLGESHSQTISTGRVSFPDPQYWGSLIPRPHNRESLTPRLSTVHTGSRGSWNEIKLLTLHRTCMLL